MSAVAHPTTADIGASPHRRGDLRLWSRSNAVAIFSEWPSRPLAARRSGPLSARLAWTALLLSTSGSGSCVAQFSARRLGAFGVLFARRQGVVQWWRVSQASTT